MISNNKNIWNTIGSNINKINILLMEIIINSKLMLMMLTVIEL